MSFALEVKEELSRVEFNSIDEKLVCLEAILKNGAEISFQSFTNPKIVISTKSNALTRFIIKLLNSFESNVSYDLYQKQIMRFDKPTYYYISINDAKKFINKFHILDSEHLMTDFDNEDLVKAYLRGAFIIRGSVNDPESGNYHLEYSTMNNNEAIYIQSLLNKFNLNSRISKRKDNLLIYLKDKEVICDTLRILGASQIVFRYEEVLITKQIVANAKRQVNFDISNQSKTNEASKNIMRYIKYLEVYYPLEKLDPKLLMVMKVRKENPEASLTELCQIINDTYNENVTKSGINHRLRKLKQIAIDYKNRNE